MKEIIYSDNIKSTMKKPILGMIKLDDDDEIEITSEEVINQNILTPFDLYNPEFWQVPYLSIKAKGADAVSNKIPTPEASKGLLNAARQFDGKTDLIFGDCGFMWASRESLYRKTGTPAITSSLEFLDLALRFTNKSVGIISWNEEPLKKLLENHTEFYRLRFVSVGDLPEWYKWACDADSYMKPGGWTKTQMEKEFKERMEEVFSANGQFSDISILIIECTLVPDFRNTIRSISSVPIFDILNFVKMLID